MEITFKMRDDDARRTLYFLQRKYKSKSGLPALAKAIILAAAAEQAKKESAESFSQIVDDEIEEYEEEYVYSGAVNQ